MKSIGRMSAAELAAFVQSRLRRRGIEVVLSGGACVSIYTRNRYVSGDADLINVGFASKRAIRDAMLTLGFEEEGRHFTHPEARFFIEFPPGPLAVGREPITDLVERRLATGTLRMLSPTDCVKDRLAAYFHWGDEQSLEQAVWVAEARDIDLREIERWARAEGMQDAFKRIRTRLAARKARETAP